MKLEEQIRNLRNHKHGLKIARMKKKNARERRKHGARSTFDLSLTADIRFQNILKN